MIDFPPMHIEDRARIEARVTRLEQRVDDVITQLEKIVDLLKKLVNGPTG